MHARIPSRFSMVTPEQFGDRSKAATPASMNGTGKDVMCIVAMTPILRMLLQKEYALLNSHSRALQKACESIE